LDVTLLIGGGAGIRTRVRRYEAPEHLHAYLTYLISDSGMPVRGPSWILSPWVSSKEQRRTL